MTYNLLTYLVAQVLPTSSATRELLEGHYGRLSIAMARNDPTAVRRVLDGLLAPGALRDRLLDLEFNAECPDPDLLATIDFRMRVLQLSVVNNRALATVEQTSDTIRYDRAGSHGPPGREHRIRSKLFYHDTWITIEGAWHLRDSRTLYESVVVDEEN